MFGIRSAALLTVTILLVTPMAAHALTKLEARSCKSTIRPNIELSPASGNAITEPELRRMARRIRREAQRVFKNSALRVGCCSKVLISPKVLIRTEGESPRPGFDQILVVRGPFTDPRCPSPDNFVWGCTPIGERIAGGWAEPQGASFSRWSIDSLGTDQNADGEDDVVPSHTYAHELGHMLGLHHTDAGTDPIMTVGRELTDDDGFGEKLVDVMANGATVNGNDTDGNGYADDVDCSDCRAASGETCCGGVWSGDFAGDLVGDDAVPGYGLYFEFEKRSGAGSLTYSVAWGYPGICTSAAEFPARCDSTANNSCSCAAGCAGSATSGSGTVSINGSAVSIDLSCLPEARDVIYTGQISRSTCCMEGTWSLDTLGGSWEACPSK